MTPWTVACQDPLSMEFSRQEYRSGLPFLTLRDLSITYQNISTETHMHTHTYTHTFRCSFLLATAFKFFVFHEFGPFDVYRNRASELHSLNIHSVLTNAIKTSLSWVVNCSSFCLHVVTKTCHNFYWIEKSGKYGRKCRGRKR